jgi:Arc/MetJ family transcription regulator
MNTRRTSVEINEHLLVAAQKTLGTKTVKATIEAALQEVLRTEARRQDVDALAGMNGLDLANDEIMSRAWRS